MDPTLSPLVTLLLSFMLGLLDGLKFIFIPVLNFVGLGLPPFLGAFGGDPVYTIGFLIGLLTVLFGVLEFIRELILYR